MTGRSPPPLYVEYFLPDSAEPIRTIVDGNRPLTLPIGRSRCQTSAPNGVHALLTIKTESGVVSRDELAALLRRRAKADDLWIDPAKIDLTEEEEEDILLGVWSGSQQLDKSAWQIVPIDRDHQRRCIQIETKGRRPIDHIQIAVQKKASIFMRCPDGAQVVFQAAKATTATPVRTLVMGGDPDVSAYWGFTQNAVSRGAFELGHRIASSLETRTESADIAVVLSHWLATFAVEDSVLHDRIALMLHKVDQTSDVRIMRWVLAAQNAPTDNVATMLGDFGNLLISIEHERPLYTEPFRLFVQHLTTAAGLLRTESEEAYNKVASGLRWVWSLASAMTWDTEHTGYRALTPGLPDANALTDDLDERAKKKSAEWRLVR